MPRGEEVDGAFLLRRVDLCHLGFWVGLGAYFLDGDPRVGPLAEAVLGAQLDDGGWNCHVRNRPATRHSSFHTTFNVLEGLRIAAARTTGCPLGSTIGIRSHAAVTSSASPSRAECLTSSLCCSGAITAGLAQWQTAVPIAACG